MGLQDTTYRTITCNQCGKTITYLHPTDLNQTVQENPWIRTSRVVTTGDQRQFLYCCDLCTAEALATGIFNVQEIPKVEIAQGSVQAQIAAAAELARRKEETGKVLKEGGPITLK